MKLYSSVSFENIENASDRNLCVAKRYSSARGMRKISSFELSIYPIQSWL